MAPSADTTTPHDTTSPWRAIFEKVRRIGGNERDEHGVVGSINWLRAHMERRDANPNVVRNIIYRDKGKVPDKRVLFEILNDLWVSRGNPPLHVPELEVMLAPGSGNDQEVLHLLGREKRRAYRSFVHGVRTDAFPKLIVTGRPGSGKTLLSDYVQQALEVEPPAAERIVRLEFTGTDLGTALVRLGTALGVPLALMESTLVKIGSSSAFAVQADAQADVARVVLEAARRFEGRQVLLLHVSQSLGGQDALAQTALRLNSPDVPRVSASEWLWLSLIEPLSRLPSTAILVSMTDLPVRAQQRLGAFEGPVKLTQPTASEARRFVRAKLPNGTATHHEAIVQRAGRSFEELRTLTLLAEIRDPASEHRASVNEKSMTQLARLVETCSDARLRSFLTTVAVLSLPEFPHFRADVLTALRCPDEDDLNPLEAAFLDPVPGQVQTFRCFSRQLARGLRETLAASDPAGYRSGHDDAARVYFGAATREPTGEDATRYLSHLFEARNWQALVAWMDDHATQQAMVRRVWLAAGKELPEGPMLQRLASHVARHYVARGSYRHQDARDAFAVLAGSDDVDVRVWTALQRVEGMVLRGQFEAARGLLAELPRPREPRLVAEAALANAAIARWRGSLADAERLVTDEVTSTLAAAAPGNDTMHARSRARLWAGLIAKDRGDLAAALAHFSPEPAGEGLTAAREAFQRGDVLMRLGHFDRALAAFDTAVDLAKRSEALVAEQTRYLARRGTTHRRRGEVAAADADFTAARSVLAGASGGGVDADPSGIADESELAFWLARVDDEASLNLLAQGRYDEAIAMLERNVHRFRRYASAQGVDATYRILRSTLRLAVAYGCRGVAQPFRRPFAVGPALDGDGLDLRHARHLFAHVVQRVETADDRLRLGTLYRDALLSANLFAARGAVSLDLALRAVATSGYPYQRAQGHAHAAVGALRIGDAETTEAHVRAARAALAASLDAASTIDGRSERGDLELKAWLICMASAAALVGGDVAAAGERLANGLRDTSLRSYHRTMLRQVGDAAEQAGLADALRASALGDALGLYPDVGTHPLRFADALVARWERRGDEARRGDACPVRREDHANHDTDPAPMLLAGSA